MKLPWCKKGTQHKSMMGSVCKGTFWSIHSIAVFMRSKRGTFVIHTFSPRSRGTAYTNNTRPDKTRDGNSIVTK